MLTAANVSSEMAVNYFIKNYYHQGSRFGVVKVLKSWGCQGQSMMKKLLKISLRGVTPDGREQLNARVVKSPTNAEPH